MRELRAREQLAWREEPVQSSRLALPALSHSCPATVGKGAILPAASGCVPLVACWQLGSGAESAGELRTAERRPEQC